MRRINIEGAIPLLRVSNFKENQSQHSGNEQQKQQFARYLAPRLSPMQDMAHTMAASSEGHLMQTYRLASGPLCGAQIQVSFAAHGLHIVLSHASAELIERLQRIQVRWQRQLHQLGFPCVLEVTHAGENIG